jgi:hypothetical protein
MQLLNGLQQLAGQREDLLGVSHYGFAYLGKAETPGAAVKQGGAQRLFQLLYLNGYRGLGYVQGFGGPGEAVVSSDGIEDIELVEVKLTAANLGAHSYWA